MKFHFSLFFSLLLSCSPAAAQSLEDVHPELFGIEVNTFQNTDVAPEEGAVNQFYKPDTGLKDFDSDGSLIESGKNRGREVNPFAKKEREEKCLIQKQQILLKIL